MRKIRINESQISGADLPRFHRGDSSGLNEHFWNEMRSELFLSADQNTEHTLIEGKCHGNRFFNCISVVTTIHVIPNTNIALAKSKLVSGRKK
jgi:hypothetical protein